MERCSVEERYPEIAQAIKCGYSRDRYPTQAPARAVDDRLVSCATARTAGKAAPTTAVIAEVRRAFTLNGKQIPPEIFRDFGDRDLADSGTIWVIIDVKAAIGSNLYFDEIRQNGA